MPCSFLALLATPPLLLQLLSSPRCSSSAPPPARCRSPELSLFKDMQVNNSRFLLNRSQGKIMGVAAGLADWTGVDALLIRLGLVAALLLTGPVVILFYVLTGWLASDR